MITRRPAAARGITKTGWLDSNHTFSFGGYYDPAHTGFRDLLVINEDFVKPGTGFGAHSHDNMEILSYVVEGALEHRDSTGSHGILRPNELQRMTAGTGVRHSEFNPSQTEPVHFLQIWILPEKEGLAPSYEQRAFPNAERRARLRLIGSRDGRAGSVTIRQDTSLFDTELDANEQVTYQLGKGRYAWVQVVRGAIRLNDVMLDSSDGAAVSNEGLIQLAAVKQAEVLLFDLA
jgi:redox-sensitive bicupin YhaK (pirin superfamily)